MQLLFVYNANSGAVNAVLDSMHKVLSPTTYDCKLCELTFGTFTEKEVWKKFREDSTVEMRFLHKNEFLKEFRSKWLPKYSFPVVLVNTNNELQLFISSEEFENVSTAEELITLIQARQSLY
jgi:hypothetical protein